MALNDGVSVIRGNRIDNIEHHAPADAKKVVLASADGSGNGVDIGSDGKVPVSITALSLPAGASTEVKQDDTITKLGDIETNQTDGSQKSQLVDAAGNPVDSHTDADGGYHLGVSLIQSIITSTNNSTTSNLASAATFTGTADETFGVNGIQVFHAADQDCTLYIDQCVDTDFNSNDTITDSFECLANTPCSRTFVSVSPYYRLRVTNNGSIATTSLASYTGMTPIINPLPRSLSNDGRLESESTLVGQQNTNRHVWVTPTNSLSIESPVRLVGTNFDGTTKDTNFWTETTANGGTATQSGEIELKTSTNAAGSASYQSVRKARFVISSALKFQGLFKFVTAATANNTRRCGAYLTTDGFFFQLVGSTFSIGTRKASSDTLINSGSFNGNYGPSFTPLSTQYYKLEIEWTPKGVFWYINGILLHKVGLGHYSNSLTLPIKFENINSGSTTDVVFDCLAAAIARLGNLITNSTSKYMTTGTHILKYGAGVLTKIIVGDNVSGSVTVYDNTAASGTLLTVLDTAVGSAPLGAMDYNVPFNDGLTMVIVGTNKITAIYE